MPTIPTYQPNQVTAQPGRLVQQQNFVDARDLAAPGAALAQAGQVLGNIAFEEMRKADDAQLLEADRRLTEWELQNLDAPETGALNKRGKDALGLPDQVLPAFDSYRAQLEEGMNSRAKARFRALADGRRGDVQKKLYSHIAQQSDQILKAESEAYKATALNAIASNSDDPERVEAEKDRLWAATYSQLVRQGATETIISAARDELNGEITGTLLDQMMAKGQYERAISFYDENRDKLGTRADEYGNAIKQARYNVQETQESDRIIREFGTGPAAIREASKIEDPVLRERVESRIDRAGIRIERARNESEKALREGAWARLEASDPTQDLQSIFTPRQMAALSAQPGAIRELENRQKQRLQGRGVQTDPAAEDELSRLRVADPQGFANTDLTKYFNRLSAADLDKWRKAQGEANDPDKQAQWATDAELLNEKVWVPLGYFGNKSAEKRGKFEAKLTAEVRAYVDANKKEPDRGEKAKMIDRLMLPFIRKNGWDTEIRLFQADEDDRLAVPDAERQEIINRRRASGKPPLTEEEIRQAYILWKGR